MVKLRKIEDSKKTYIKNRMKIGKNEKIEIESKTLEKIDKIEIKSKI